MRIFGLAIVVALGWPVSMAAQVASVEVSPSKQSIVAGQTLQVTARAKDAAGNTVAGGQVLWLSGPFEIASVDQQGLVRAFRQGNLKIVARIGGKTGSAEFTVLPKPPVKVVVSAPQATVVVGGLLDLTATPLTEDEEPLLGRALGFRSSAPAVATVDPGGVVTGHSAGRAVVTVTDGSVSGTFSVTVVPNPVVKLEVAGAASTRTGDVVRMTVKGFDRTGYANFVTPQANWT